MFNMEKCYRNKIIIIINIIIIIIIIISRQCPYNNGNKDTWEKIFFFFACVCMQSTMLRVTKFDTKILVIK